MYKRITTTNEIQVKEATLKYNKCQFILQFKKNVISSLYVLVLYFL